MGEIASITYRLLSTENIEVFTYPDKKTIVADSTKGRVLGVYLHPIVVNVVEVK